MLEVSKAVEVVNSLDTGVDGQSRTLDERLATATVHALERTVRQLGPSLVTYRSFVWIRK